MAVEVEDLIVQPFRELINRGNEAIANAEAARPEDVVLAQLMLKSARAVVREGERALQRIEPLLLGHLEKYGDAFRDAARECDDIFQIQKQLEDVLYDIDDYIEVETFDVVKFAQLQAASKTFALGAIDNIRRLRIGEIPILPRKFPPLPPLPRKRPSRIEPLTISRPATRNGNYGMDQLIFSPHASSAPPTALTHRPMFSSLQSSPGQGHMLHRINSKKSQKSLTPSTSSSDSQYSQASFQWSSPTESVLRSYQSQKLSDVDLLGEEIHDLLSEPNSPKYLEPRPENRSTLPPTSTPWTSAWVHDQLSSSRDLMLEETIPEDVAIESHSEGSLSGRPSGETYVEQPGEELQGYLPSKRYTVESDTLAGVVFNPSCPPPRPHRASMFPAPNTQLSHVRNTSDSSTSDQRSISQAPPVYETLGGRCSKGPQSTIGQQSADIQHPIMGTTDSILESMIDESPIVKISVLQPPTYEPSNLEVLPQEKNTVTEPINATINTAMNTAMKPRVASHQNPKPMWYSREENCTISADSTLFQLKSFCEGALAFKNGRYREATKTAVFVDTGAHAATSAAYHDSMTGAALALGANAPMAFGIRKTVTQCIKCEYSQSVADFRRDMAKDQRANSTQEGVNFRMRFLYKSHLAAESRPTTLYGCIFCAHLGYTCREGDATVFTTERQLFRHLSQHPQPLPQVPGVAVLYGYLGSSCPEAEDYDLHFPSPQFASPIIPEAPLLMKRPTAVAHQGQLQKEGGKPLTDPDGRRGVLQFLKGARIVGVEFPDAWGGKWCTGWHDGVRGAFPVKLVTLEAPPKSDIRLPGGNNDGVIVTARWKWESKDASAGWLAIDKHTTITNVSWLSYDSWCWSGMTKDGKVGIFPSSHIKADSIRDPTGANGLPLVKKESRRLFKIRHTKTGSFSSSNY